MVGWGVTKEGPDEFTKGGSQLCPVWTGSVSVSCDILSTPTCPGNVHHSELYVDRTPTVRSLAYTHPAVDNL